MSEIQRAPLRAVNVRSLPRTQDVVSVAMNTQVWRDRNRNVLGARYRRSAARGYVAAVKPIMRSSRTGEYWMVVRILKPEPDRTPWYVVCAMGACGAAAGIGYGLWHARYVFAYGIGTLAGIALLCFLGTRIGHSGVCLGIHCSGCRG